ncbi:NADH:flavin oxidoreductase [Solemya velum gill symbiont]|uniref:NADH:flavin oxidoreductase n=1 Tax=Solemya velum gill symbiont TaxID=2340 RepID=A0A0B0H487_SOVGS|nr:NADH:flavin oxidoreductase [Solemya velum gill symbiont]
MSLQLFLPYEERTLSLKNRMVMAPMTRCRAAEGDIPTPLMAEYYAQRATAGLIITEGIPVSNKARGYLWTPGIYTREQTDGWKQVTAAVHEKSCQIYAQIWHTGRVSHTSLQPNNEQPEGATDEAPGDAVCFATRMATRLTFQSVHLYHWKQKGLREYATSLYRPR